MSLELRPTTPGASCAGFDCSNPRDPVLSVNRGSMGIMEMKKETSIVYCGY